MNWTAALIGSSLILGLYSPIFLRAMAKLTNEWYSDRNGYAANLFGVVCNSVVIIFVLRLLELWQFDGTEKLSYLNNTVTFQMSNEFI